jgi:HEPN domain-containing protein
MANDSFEGGQVKHEIDSAVSRMTRQMQLKKAVTYDVWLEYAKRDYDTAEYNFNEGRVEVAIFYLQQSIEKHLKALLRLNDIIVDKTLLTEKGYDWNEHHLNNLCKLCGYSLPTKSEKEIWLRDISFSYTHSRYPDIPFIPIRDRRPWNYYKKYAEEYMAFAKELIERIEEDIDTEKEIIL